MRSKRNYTLFIQLFIFTLFLLIWEILSSKNIINSFLLSKPSSIFNLLVEYIKNKKIWSHCLISINEAIFGLILGTILGLILQHFNFGF